MEHVRKAAAYPIQTVSCCSCGKSFKAHRLENGKAGCPHCGTQALVMLHVCGDCFAVLRGKEPRREPYKCPVCDGRGMVDNITCLACKGTCIVWGGD